MAGGLGLVTGGLFGGAADDGDGDKVSFVTPGELGEIAEDFGADVRRLIT